MRQGVKTLFEVLNSITKHDKCPSCGLNFGERKKCPKCGRDACDKCVAVDNTDCMFCGPHGEEAKEIFKPYHDQVKANISFVDETGSDEEIEAINKILKRT